MTPIARTRTPWTTPDLLAAYAVAWREVLVVEPPRAALAILWGQATLECGRGGSSCWCHNVGNVRASADEPHALLPGAYEFGATLPAGATQIPPPPGAAVPPGRPICYLLPASVQRFRAYSSLSEGCAGKLALLLRRWPAAVDALRDAEGAEAAVQFVAALRGYFTGDAGQYASSVRSLAAECLRGPESQWPQDRRDTLPSPVSHWTDARPVEIPQAVDVVAELASGGDRSEGADTPDSARSMDPTDGTS